MKVPKIEFPSEYPIKVIGDAGPFFEQRVLEVVRTYDADLTEDKVSERPSRKGNYLALTLRVWVLSETQLQAMFEELNAIPNVRMVL